jgi:hypothetical protein
MYLWQKAAPSHWLKAREEILQARFGGALSIVSVATRSSSLQCVAVGNGSQS